MSILTRTRTTEAAAPVATPPPSVAPPNQTPPVATAPVAAPAPPTREQRRWHELQSLKGLNLGAAVFGWLVTVGISVLVTALIAAGGTAVGLQQGTVANVSGSATTVTLGGAALLLLVLLVSYYAGGYVAGRLSRFSGALQGFAVWVIGAVVTGALAIAGAVVGAQYNVLGQLRLPSIPVNGQTLVDGGVVALVVIAAATLLVALLGGMVGRRYHSRVDRALTGAGATPRV